MNRIALFTLAILTLLLITQANTTSAAADHRAMSSDVLSEHLRATTGGSVFTVNSTANIQDASVGNGVCSTSSGSGGVCTLFAAIQEANATNEHDIINFNIPGSGPHIIGTNGNGGLGLPRIDEPVTIDGTSQLGASCPNVTSPATLMIQIEPLLDAEFGLRFFGDADASIVKGLSIGGFAEDGIHIDRTTTDIRIECNHIGVATDGVTAIPNGDGINIDGNDTVIGGTTSNARTQRNVISGNTSWGIRIVREFSGFDIDATITGNYIGTNALGNAALGNATGIGIMNMENVLIGNSQPYQGNLISGNTGSGIFISRESRNVEIYNNIIGGNIFGGSGIPNQNGITVATAENESSSASEIFIGGPLAGFGNTIISNLLDGIKIENSLNDTDIGSVTIRGNRIRDNGQLGIDLGNDGVDVNDDKDVDTGPNGKQNWPVLFSAENNGRLKGELNTRVTPTAIPYFIDVYESSSCDPSGNGEGATYLDTFTVSSSGNAVPFDTVIDTNPTTDRYITLIANDSATGNSSEFGNCVQATRSGFVVDLANGGAFSDDATPGDAICDNGQGDCTLRAAIMETNALNGSDPINIYFDLGANRQIALSDASAIPTVTAPVIIDGIADNAPAACPTSPGHSAKLLVTLDGFNLPPSNPNLITLGAGSDGSIVRGLAFVKAQFGHGIFITGNSNTVECSWFGLGETSALDGANLSGMLVRGNNNVIGGTTDAQRNVIVSSTQDGIQLGSAGQYNKVEGNYVGINATGDNALPNRRGVYVTDMATDAIVKGNVVSGNTQDGIGVDLNADGALVENNVVGLSWDGSAEIGNGMNGIQLQDTDDATVMGNQVAANGQSGIYARNHENLMIANNSVTNNDSIGISISQNAAGVSDNIAIDNNMVSNNGVREITVSRSSNVVLTRNTLSGLGLSFSTVSNSTIGGSSGALGNIFTNYSNAISIFNSSSVLVQHNTLDGSGSRADATSAVAVSGTGSAITIRDNTIKNHSQHAVVVLSSVQSVQILSNSIKDSGFPSIDLNNDGVTANDVLDVDTGPSGLQNFPVVTSADADTGVIKFEINTLSKIDVLVQLFRNDACNGTHGDGQTLLGETTVMTDDDGNALATLTLSGFFGGDAITATATDVAKGHTSEFSACTTAIGASAPTAVGMGVAAAGGEPQRVVLLGLLMLLGRTVAVFGRKSHPKKR